MKKPTVLYTIRQGNNDHMFLVSKMTSDMEIMAVYTIAATEKGHGLVCSCPAHKPWCRHCEMLRLFQAEGRIGKGWFYNHDTHLWIEPLPIQE